MREFAVTTQDLKDWAFFASERFRQDKFSRNLKDRTDFAEDGEIVFGLGISTADSEAADGKCFRPSTVASFRDRRTLGGRAYPWLACMTSFAKTTIPLSRPARSASNPTNYFSRPKQLRTNFAKIFRIELRALGRTAAVTDEDFAVTETSTTKPLFIFPAAEKSTEIEMPVAFDAKVLW